jgi:hypothetical protein
MRIFNRPTLSTLLAAIFFVLFLQIVCSWGFMRFVHVRAQNQFLAPEYYDVEVVTGEDFRHLSDPAQREVTLSDGTRIMKAAVWEEFVLKNYKAAADGKFYVLVMTKGTAHVLPYVEPNFILIGFFTFCGLAVSLWNLRSIRKEQPTALGPRGSEPISRSS